MDGSLPNQCFDIVLDKGLFDVLLCSPKGLISIEELEREMYRILKKDGVYLVISHAAPSHRMSQLTRNNLFTIEHTVIPRPMVCVLL